MRANGRRVRAGWWRHCLALAAACQIVGLAVPCPSAAPDAPVPDAPVPAATPPAALGPAPVRTGVQAAGRGRELIGAADLLEVRVFELPELQSSVRVKADGTISLPLIGSLAVAGMTEADAEANLKKILADRYVKDPHVSVLVKEHESRKISVIGAVVRPGAYPLLA